MTPPARSFWAVSGSLAAVSLHGRGGWPPRSEQFRFARRTWRPALWQAEHAAEFVRHKVDV
jgi:hypothetical protein